MPGSGNITKEHTVWCATCEKWEQFCENTIRKTMVAAKLKGWKNIKGLWICYECIAKE